MLNDPKQADDAVTVLEQLGDPSAIKPLGDAWASTGRPLHWLQVIIALAHPLTPAEASAQMFVDYERTGRPAHWDLALPFLIAATVVDETSPASVEGASMAAIALGEAKLAGAVEALAALAVQPANKETFGAQVAAIAALGKIPVPRSAATLVGIIERDGPGRPATATNPEMRREREEAYSRFLAVTGATINALAELRAPTAAEPLVLALYRTPELFVQLRRALVAIGAPAERELVSALRGDNAGVTQLFASKHLDKYCGDRGDASPAQCLPVSAKDFYPAALLGDFHDSMVVPELLAALRRPALPSYYLDDQPSPNTQHNAIADSLRKLGAPEAAAPLRALWQDKKAALPTRISALGAYPFVSRDGAGTAELAAITADNAADEDLRVEAATALARLSTSAADLVVMTKLAKKYHDASAAKARAAAAKQHDFNVADQAYTKAKESFDQARRQLLATTGDSTKSTQEIRAATDAFQKLEGSYKLARKKHKELTAPYRQLDSAAKAYLRFARMFEAHLARIELGVRCQSDLPCYAATLTASVDAIVHDNAPHIPDLASWTADEKHELLLATRDRALVEIGKRGPAASTLTDAVLDAVVSGIAQGDHLVAQAALLALPKIAARPCARCATQLAGAPLRDKDSRITDLTAELQVLRNYFDEN